MHALSFSGKNIKYYQKLHPRPPSGIDNTNLVPIEWARISQIFALFIVPKGIKPENIAKDSPVVAIWHDT